MLLRNAQEHLSARRRGARLRHRRSEM
jgi:hypothetical protein